jgi:hypothetical protein
MTTRITKTWFDGEKVVTQEIPESEIYKQEPVAWEDVLGAIARGWTHPENARKPMDVELAVAIAKEIQDMYTAPPQHDFAYQQAVSLAKAIFKKHFAHEEHYASGRIVWEPLDTTAGVISQIDNMTCRLVAPPQQCPRCGKTDPAEVHTCTPKQEPVLVVEKEPDYMSRGHFHEGTKPHIDPTKVWALPIGTKLYTAPPQRQPLTKEEIRDLWREATIKPCYTSELIQTFARAIERKIGGDA